MYNLYKLKFTLLRILFFESWKIHMVLITTVFIVFLNYGIFQTNRRENKYNELRVPITQLQQVYTHSASLFHPFSHPLWVLLSPPPLMFRQVPDIILFVIISWHTLKGNLPVTFFQKFCMHWSRIVLLLSRAFWTWVFLTQVYNNV